MRTSYGEDPSQFAELRYPTGKGPFPLLFVVHGGFWQSRYDLSHIGHLCAALTSKGMITCSIEYRRIGNLGGGWPGTFQDISLATRNIVQTTSSDLRFDHARTAILGHSAGGHLALWLAGSHQISKSSPLHMDQRQADDDTVPLSQSEAYVDKAEKLGDWPTLVKLDGVGHYELIDPESEAWPPVAKAVLSLLDLDRHQ